MTGTRTFASGWTSVVGLTCYVLATVLVAWTLWATLTSSRYTARAKEFSRQAESDLSSGTRLAASMRGIEAVRHLDVAQQLYEFDNRLAAYERRSASDLTVGSRIAGGGAAALLGLGYWLRRRRLPLERGRLRRAA